MTDDIPLQVAAASAALVHDKWLPGLKEAEAAALVLELAGLVRQYPDSKPETLWISVQASHGFGAWSDAGWRVQRAWGCFAAVLVAMDEGMRPEPKPPKPRKQEGFIHPTIYDPIIPLDELVRR